METLEKKGKGSALFPFLLFIVIYLGAGLYFQFQPGQGLHRPEIHHLRTGRRQ